MYAIFKLTFELCVGGGDKYLYYLAVGSSLKNLPEPLRCVNSRRSQLEECKKLLVHTSTSTSDVCAFLN